MAKEASQKTIIAYAQTQAAHTVWAMVLSVKMAEIGLSISSLSSINFVAFLSQCSALAFNDENGVDKSVASTKEHKKEIIRAVKR